METSPKSAPETSGVNAEHKTTERPVGESKENDDVNAYDAEVTDPNNRLAVPAQLELSAYDAESEGADGAHDALMANDEVKAQLAEIDFSDQLAVPNNDPVTPDKAVKLPLTKTSLLKLPVPSKQIINPAPS